MVGSRSDTRFSSIHVKQGRRKPRVLPLPVAATPITSYCCIARGQQYCWICEGAGKPARSSWSLRPGGKGTSSKVAKRMTFCTRCPRASITFTSWSWTVAPLPPEAVSLARSAMLGKPPAGPAAGQAPWPPCWCPPCCGCPPCCCQACPCGKPCGCACWPGHICCGICICSGGMPPQPPAMPPWNCHPAIALEGPGAARRGGRE
mmetsp:Transcript_57166/g.161397  ORF Transcript_57166/g.161397 Transcript_57166/m.161397 type:complete len:204 (-) Transcript_57166:50-661(-)